MKFTTVFTFVISTAVAVHGAAIEQRSTCKTVASGYLAANVTSIGTLKAFSASNDNKVIYNGSGANGILAAFQVCGPFGETEPGSGEYAGRVYLSTKNTCITITNQASAAAPYYPAVAACDGSASQAFVYRTNERNAIYWSGKTDAEGTTPQGGCGLFGYMSKNKGTPITLPGSNQIELGCYGKATPFYFSSAAH